MLVFCWEGASTKEEINNAGEMGNNNCRSRDFEMVRRDGIQGILRRGFGRSQDAFFNLIGREADLGKDNGGKKKPKGLLVSLCFMKICESSRHNNAREVLGS